MKSVSRKANIAMDQSSLMHLVLVAAAFCGAAYLGTVSVRARLGGPDALWYANVSWYAARILLSIGALIAIYASYLFATGNVHTVINGELYRSGQVTPAMIKDLKQRFGIRSIINLRGRNEAKRWYIDEVETAAALDITHIDYRMSMKRQLTTGGWTELIEIMKAAPKPLLIHCQGGSDRTGLASALYLSAITGLDEERAEAQLGVRYGHVALPFLSRAYAMDATFDAYETWRETLAADTAAQRPDLGATSN